MPLPINFPSIACTPVICLSLQDGCVKQVLSAWPFMLPINDLSEASDVCLFPYFMQRVNDLSEDSDVCLFVYFMQRVNNLSKTSFMLLSLYFILPVNDLFPTCVICYACPF